jgi:hypothetical protein
VKKGVDYARLEAEYITGHWTLAQLSERHGLSIQAISKRAKVRGWKQDQTAKVHAARRNKLAHEAAVETGLRDAVEAAASQQVDVIREHKGRAGQARALIQKLLTELDWSTDHLETLERAIALADNGEPFDRQNLRTAFARATALPARAGALQKIVSSLATLVEIERKAYGIEDKPPETETYEERLRRLIDEAMQAEPGADPGVPTGT